MRPLRPLATAFGFLSRLPVGSSDVEAADLVACGMRALAPSAAAVVSALALALVTWRRVGGLTGDGYGAAIELAELAFLASASLQRGP
jgi:cobalamin synthase